MGANGDVGEVTGIILAGGRGRRFDGVNKALLEVRGQRIVDRQLTALRAVTSAQLIIASDASPFSGLHVPVMADVIPELGPLGGLYTALAAVTSPRVLVVACDLPFVSAPFLQFLIERAPAADAVVPRTARGLQPLCSVWSTRLLPIVESRIVAGRLAVYGLLDVIDAVVLEPAELAPFDPAGDLLANVNTPSDLEAVQRRDRHLETAPPPGP